MPAEPCMLTTKDFTILEVMHDRSSGPDDPLADILARKLDAAQVMFREDVPADVATLSSRVTFSVDGRDPDTRILSHDRMAAAVGMFLPITTPRGLALLGLAEGQQFVLTDRDGQTETLVLEKVQYQPEAARREKETMARLAPRPGRPVLRLIRGSLGAAAVPDEPGPSAA